MLQMQQDKINNFSKTLVTRYISRRPIELAAKTIVASDYKGGEPLNALLVGPERHLLDYMLQFGIALA